MKPEVHPSIVNGYNLKIKKKMNMVPWRKKKCVVIIVLSTLWVFCEYQLTYSRIPTTFSLPSNKGYAGEKFYSSQRRSGYTPMLEPDSGNLTNDLKHILWPRPHLWLLSVLRGYGFQECDVQTCKLHVEEDEYYTASNAVIFNDPHYVPSYVRPPHQVWAFMLMEPPQNAPFLSGFGDNIWRWKINWTMTYRSDSDIVLSYGSIKKSRTPRYSSELLDVIIKKKTKQIAWVVSHCVTASNREGYVKELSRYIQVDIYGDCGMAIGKNKSIFDRLENEYKFYLAFENSICKDYVTEKFFYLQTKNLVLIVMGGANYSRITPQDTYIDVRDFSSPRQLANRLLYLDKNDTAYKKYLEKKAFYTSREDIIIGLCELCAKLHQKNQETKSYENIYEWYSNNMCSSIFDMWFINRLFFSGLESLGNLLLYPLRVISKLLAFS